jgi:hypothetical protein
MDKAEALALLGAHLQAWRQRSYAELTALIGSQGCTELVGASGATYYVEVQPFWDAKPGGDIRVIGAIDDGGFRTFVPLTVDFILAPDGHFVGNGS